MKTPTTAFANPPVILSDFELAEKHLPDSQTIVILFIVVTLLIIKSRNCIYRLLGKFTNIIEINGWTVGSGIGKLWLNLSSKAWLDIFQLPTFSMDFECHGFNQNKSGILLQYCLRLQRCGIWKCYRLCSAGS